MLYSVWYVRLGLFFIAWFRYLKACFSCFCARRRVCKFWSCCCLCRSAICSWSVLNSAPLVLYYDRTTAASSLKQQLNRPLAFWKSGNLYSVMLKSTSKIASAGQSIEPKRLLLLRLVFNFFKNLSFQLTFIQLCNPYYWILIGDVQLWFNQVPFCTPDGTSEDNKIKIKIVSKRLSFCLIIT